MELKDFYVGTLFGTFLLYTFPHFDTRSHKPDEAGVHEIALLSRPNVGARFHIPTGLLICQSVDQSCIAAPPLLHLWWHLLPSVLQKHPCAKSPKHLFIKTKATLVSNSILFFLISM